MQKHVEAAREAFGRLDPDGFAAAVEPINETMACYRDLITPDMAAQLHEVEALSWFLKRDEEQAVASFRSMVAATPEATLDDSLAPEGGPLHTLLSIARDAQPGEVVEVAPEPGVMLTLDGGQATTRPLERPTLAQFFNTSDGTTVTTRLVRAGEEFPAVEPTRVAPVGAPVYIPPVTEKERRPLLPLAVVSGAGFVAAGALSVVGGSSRRQYDDPATSYEDLDGLRARTNSMATGATIATAVGAAAGVGFGVSWAL